MLSTRSFLALVVVLALVPPGAAYAADADDAVVDNTDDTAAFASPGSLDFGQICIGGTATGHVAVAVRRQNHGQNANVFKDGGSVSVSRTTLSSTPSIVNAPNGILGSITIPSTWSSAAPGTLSPSVSTTATYSPVAVGAMTGAIGYRATGPAAQGNMHDAAVTLNLSGTGRVCDTTAPVITPSVTGTLGNNGWYVGDVTVSFTVTDPESTVTSSTGCGSVSRTTDTSGTSYECRATSTGGTSSSTVSIKRDATAPTGLSVSATPTAPPSGWFPSPFTATWQGTDATSGIASCSSVPYSGPDTSAGSVSGSCTDQAGNTAAGPSFAFKYDATGPDIVGTPARDPDHGDWYNSPVEVSWSGAPGQVSDVTCDEESTTYGDDAGESDSATASVTVACQDAAGNPGTGTFALQYDATAPSAGIAADRDPDHGGWFNHALTATTTGLDDTSGIVSCTPSQLYSGPDTAAATLSGTCTDDAGNTSSTATFDFKYDATAPTAELALSDNVHNGWYRDTVTGTTTGTDNLSGVTCSAPQTYDGPDGIDRSLTGTCVDEAGNTSAPDAKLFNFDGTAPVITFASRTAANANGWNNGPVTATWTCSDALSGPASDSVSATLSDEGAGQTAVGTCEDLAGNTASDGEDGINVDLHAPEPPTVHVDPRPNTHGWNRTQPVTVSFTDNGDAGPSGVGTCTPASSVETETLGEVVSGTCTDLAGNESAPADATVKIDLTDPNAPTATADSSPAFGSWFKDTVTVIFGDAGDAGDVRSGVDPSSVPAPVTYSTSGSHTASGRVTDLAGNDSAPGTLTVAVDATAPDLTLTCPSGDTVLGSTPDATWTATDAHSGLAGASQGTTPLDTAAVGTQTASVPAGTARDNVGHGSAAKTCDYRVVYGWNGFLQPINDTAHTGVFESKFKTGSTIPVKFRLTDADQRSVQSSTPPQFQVSGNRGGCDTLGSTETLPDSTTVTPGTAFKWSSTDSQYQYNFNTKGKAAGEYRVWATGLGDGVNHYVDICLIR